MDATNYEGYDIVAKPNQLTGGSWQINITIIEHLGSKVKSTGFSAKTAFSIREQAVQACFEFGKQIIDGKVKGCSVRKEQES